MQTFDERRKKSDGGRFASTGWKIQSDLLQFVSERSSAVLRLGAATWHITRISDVLISVRAVVNY